MVSVCVELLVCLSVAGRGHPLCYLSSPGTWRLRPVCSCLSSSLCWLAGNHVPNSFIFPCRSPKRLVASCLIASVASSSPRTNPSSSLHLSSALTEVAWHSARKRDRPTLARSHSRPQSLQMLLCFHLISFRPPATLLLNSCWPPSPCGSSFQDHSPSLSLSQ